VLDRERDREDQLRGARCHHDTADDRAAAVGGEELDEPVTQVLHLGAGVGRERQHDCSRVDDPFVDLPLGTTHGGYLGVGEDVGADALHVEGSDRVPQRVRHRDPALHRGNRRKG
jgi:hypothetical protein